MSILLDSLKSKKDQEEIIVPSVHDSHFDDEMLNDDALSESVRIWKLVSILLLVSLITSWIYFYLSTSEKPPSKSNSLLKIENFEKKLVVDNSEDISNIPVTEITNQYKPQKRKIKNNVVTESNSIKKNTGEDVISSPVKKNSTISKINYASDQYSQKDVIYYEELTTDILVALPSLEISSYAISSNAKKSFIVLNNSFYGVGETIAPNLQLLSIDKQSVLFQYKDLYIRKKYK